MYFVGLKDNEEGVFIVSRYLFWIDDKLVIRKNI